MPSMRSLFSSSVSLAIVAVVLVGCPEKPDYAPAILVNPATLDFGAEEAALTFVVSNVWTSRPLPTFTVTANQAWIGMTPTTGTSTGPEDPVTVTVTVDRALMASGENTGTVFITAPGVAQQTVTVKARAILVASFSAATTLPFVGDPLVFFDQSSTAQGYGPITNWDWDFGDGGTSTQPNPVHTYNAADVYTVTLTVQTATRIATRTRTNYITARDKLPPNADFVASNRNPTALYSTVQFVDLSDPGTAPPITDWFWNFGDGNQSSLRNPTHIFGIREIYTVYYDIYLTVTTAHGSDAEVKLGYIGVQPALPTAEFTVSNQSPLVDTPVQFFDLSQPGSGDITTWFWEFGDGGTSGQVNPSHMYTTPGAKTVKLTVTTAVGPHTTTKVGYINVRALPPDAEFTVDDTNPAVGQTIQFTDQSTPGSAPTILSWLWNFGDGSTSGVQNPTHFYTANSLYDVSLTVTSVYGSNTETKPDYIVVGSALDGYLNNGDTTYRVEEVTTETGMFYNAYICKMYSQTWDMGADHTEWWHWMTIIEPKTKSLTDTALLLVDGGSSGNSRPEITGDLANMANGLGLLGITFAQVSQVPNQPIVFDDDPLSESRSEDEIIAYTFSRFLDLYDTDRATAEQWPALLPMVKSAVKAMDTVQSFVPGIDNFVVAGASKRGWTTWLTAATDPERRVSAAIPLVIDMLNMDDSFNHHHDAYRHETGGNFISGYSIQVEDYVIEGVLDWQDTPPYHALQAIVDPYMYRDRLTMPKYLVNGSKDEFFLPDSGQFYWDDLLGPKHVQYRPNEGHGLSGAYEDVLFSVAPWYMSTAQNMSVPTFTWATTDLPGGDLGLAVTTSLSDAPILNSVTLWQATTVTGHRDFRNDSAPGVTWTDTTINDNDDGTVDGIYTATVVAPPADTWRGAFVELEYTSPFTVPLVGDPMPYVFTTQVFVIPDTYPTAP
ncbi:MAG: PKD domain-containing protein [bacterium]|nr:PKD domain-containing protein [bacterium]